MCHRAYEENDPAGRSKTEREVRAGVAEVRRPLPGPGRRVLKMDGDAPVARNKMFLMFSCLDLCECVPYSARGEFEGEGNRNATRRRTYLHRLGSLARHGSRAPCVTCPVGA